MASKCCQLLQCHAKMYAKWYTAERLASFSTQCISQQMVVPLCWGLSTIVLRTWPFTNHSVDHDHETCNVVLNAHKLDAVIRVKFYIQNLWPETTGDGGLQVMGALQSKRNSLLQSNLVYTACSWLMTIWFPSFIQTCIAARRTSSVLTCDMETSPPFMIQAWSSPTTGCALLTPSRCPSREAIPARGRDRQTSRALQSVQALRILWCSCLARMDDLSYNSQNCTISLSVLPPAAGDKYV